MTDFDQHLREANPARVEWIEVGEFGGGGAPAFENAWVNHLAGYRTAAFYKDQFGVVYLKGLVKNGVIGSKIFTLPLGFRPVQDQVLHATVSNSAIGRVDIGTDGGVYPQLGNNAWFSLEGVSFRI